MADTAGSVEANPSLQEELFIIQALKIRKFHLQISLQFQQVSWNLTFSWRSVLGTIKVSHTKSDISTIGWGKQKQNVKIREIVKGQMDKKK